MLTDPRNGHSWPETSEKGPYLAGWADLALLCFQATQLSSRDSAHTLLVPLSSSEKVRAVQLVGNGWTPGSPQSQEAPCREVTWPWDQTHSRALGKRPPWPET